MKRLLLLTLLLFGSFIGKSQCNYELCITDDFGDGWNGNTVDVFVNGALYGNYGATLVGSGPECFFISVNNGDDIDVVFVGSGLYEYECNFALTDASGNSAGTGDDISNINNVIGNCPCGATVVSADPELVLNCSGLQDTINFVAGGICTGTYEYQILIGGTVVQSWSTSSVFYPSPSANTTYTVQARCSTCPASVASDNFDVEILDAPTITGNLEFCAVGSTSITASGSTGDFEWFTDETGGTQLATTPTYTTPGLSDTTTYWLQTNGLSTTTGTILITECGLEGFAGASSADYLEISNLYATPVNTTGWVAAISADYTNINNVNTILWDLPTTFNACSVVSKNDISGDPNYWGNNIMWNPGANTSFRSWAIIIDDVGQVVDFVAWGWTAADIAGFNPTINGFNITLGAEWAGNGCDATCGVAGGPQLSIQRIGNQDGNTLADFVCQPSTPDVVNPGLTCGWTPVSCRTPVTVIVNPLPVATVIESAVLCAGGSTGSIDVTATTGNPTYQYSIDGGSTFQGSNVFGGLPTGNYTIDVEDANGCATTVNATVTEPLPLAGSLVSTTDATCGQANGSGTVSATDGTPGYQYSIDGGTTFQASAVFGGLTAGNYTVTIEDLNGCQVTVPFTVLDFSGLIAQIDAQINVSCFSGSDGTVTVSASGSTPAYSYAIDGVTFVASGTFSGLSAGAYTITAEDNVGCQVTVPVTITEPTVLAGTLDATTDVLCAGGNNGSLTVSGSGATPTYQYSIDGGTTFQASGTFGTLTAGTYTVTIEDLNGCQITVNGTINEPLALTGSVVTTTDATCGQANGSGEVAAANGTAAYQYSIDGGTTFQASGVFGTLAPGTYTVTIQDLNNCQTTVPVTINDLSGLTAQIDAQVDVTCFGGTDGSVTVSASGSTAPYTYSIDGGTTFQATGSYTGLTSGSYTIICEDFNGCQFPVAVTIIEPTVLVGTLLGTNDVTCFGGVDGSLTVSASGATPTYQYSIDGGTTFQASGTFSNLIASGYTVTVEDGGGCQTTVNATINEPTVLVGNLDATVDVSCFGGTDGSLTVSASGATPTYQYSIDGGTTFQAGGTFSNLALGAYIITVEDASGCQTTVNATINEPTVVIGTYVSANDATCGNPNGDFEVAGSGGTPTYQYSIDGGITFQATGAFTGLMGGTYTITVQDANSCQGTTTMTISNLGSPTIDQVMVIDATCSGTCDGQIAINATGATQYSIDNGVTFQASNIFSNVCAGTYDIAIINTAGCLEYSTAIITEPSPLVVSFTTTDLICYSVCDGEINITASGGTPALQYSIDNGASFSLNGSFTGLCAGTYDILIQDGGTCTYTAQAMLFEPALLGTSITITDAMCAGSCDGEINSAPTGGTGNYSYTWSPAQTGNNPIASNLCVGPFTLTITDGNGCSIDTTVNVNGPPGIVMSPTTFTDEICNGDCSGSITINATDASLFSVDGTNFVGSNVFTGLCVGNYTVYAQNPNGCFETDQVTIGSPAVVTVVAQSDTTICIGGTASLNAASSGGVGSFTYSWDNTITTQGNNVSPVTTQDYCVTTVDGNGCISAPSCVTVTVNQPLDVIALSDQLICVDETAQISASGSGGNGGPYTYTWDQGVGTGANQAVTPPGTTIYTVSVTDGCESPAVSASVTITINATPNIMFTGDVLAGCFPLDVGFEEVNVPFGSQCFWEFGDGGTSTDCNIAYHTYTQPGCWDVTLTVTTPEGCIVVYNMANYVCTYDYPVPAFTFGPQPATIANPTITFSNLSTGAATYEWVFDPFGLADTDNSTNPEYTFIDEPGTYEVCLTATSSAGCSADTCDNVVIDDEFLLYVPNSFTPNGDGINDVFLPKVNGVDPLDYTFMIFNRWGELIFDSHHPTIGWDGNYKSVLSENGAYVWKISCRDGSSAERHEYIGHVTLIR